MWVVVVMLNEQIDIDADEDIAAGRPLPPAALIMLLSACRGIISRLFFLNTPSTPSPASIMLAAVPQERSVVADVAANDWTCSERHWLGLCAHLRDVSCIMMRKAYHRYKSSPSWSSSFGFTDAVFEIDERHSHAIFDGLHASLERDQHLGAHAFQQHDVCDDAIQNKISHIDAAALEDDGAAAAFDLVAWRTTGLRLADSSLHLPLVPKSCGTASCAFSSQIL
jgi:hypothetical protein